MSTPELRNKLAALSFSEKIKILEKLRDRSIAIAAAGLRRKSPGEMRDQEMKEDRGQVESSLS